jgi:GDP-L-fucose synthase
MKLLITGANGFLGAALPRYLGHHEITAVSRQQLDLTNSRAVREYFLQHEYDAVINCAAAGRYTPEAVDPGIVSNNLESIINLLLNNGSYGKLINFGTGAEFDITQPIIKAQERDIWKRSPAQSYGASKNLTAKLLARQERCHTLRLFGCFDGSEDNKRIIKKCHSAVSQGNTFVVSQDRWFDMVSVRDIAQAVESVLNGQLADKDINVVYAQKTTLSDALKLYCSSNGFDSELVQAQGNLGLEYTGDSTRIAPIAKDLIGLEQSFKEYNL